MTPNASPSCYPRRNGDSALGGRSTNTARPGTAHRGQQALCRQVQASILKTGWLVFWNRRLSALWRLLLRKDVLAAGELTGAPASSPLINCLCGPVNQTPVRQRQTEGGSGPAPSFCLNATSLAAVARAR